jgi:hypothetical protein
MLEFGNFVIAGCRNSMSETCPTLIKSYVPHPSLKESD